MHKRFFALIVLAMAIVITGCTTAVQSPKLPELEQKPYDGGRIIEVPVGKFGYLLAEGPVTIHSLTDIGDWSTFEVPAGQFAIVFSRGHDFSVEGLISNAPSALSEKDEIDWDAAQPLVDLTGGKGFLFLVITEKGFIQESAIDGR